ncbi:MAG: tetratricopeptide repeat protein [Ktedonobacteraceae bacterium]
MDKRLSNRKKRVPNFRLREAREQRGLAHKDVADFIGLPDSHTVGRWERGESFPQPHYRQKLIHLFGKSAKELGLVKARFDEHTQQPEAPPGLSESRQTPEYIWKVPHPFSSFIGREQDIVTVSDLLKQTGVHLVTLLGPGGVGKTRLSIQIANTMREYFIGGVCFVSLASINDPILVLPTVVQALGMQEGGSQSIIERIKSVLRDTPFLFVLDNFEQVVTAAPLLEELLTACPGLKVLVTSRTVLHLHAEHEYPIAPLVTPDPVQLTAPESLIQYPAIALFVQRAQTILPTFQLTQSNAQAVAKICMRLDGLPLAIELAAARIKLFPPQAVLAQLAKDFQLLKSDLRNMPARQKTLYNTIKWSYDLLDEQEQWFFRHLSIFPGGCTLDAAEAILRNEQTSDMLNTIASLLDKSLLQQVEQDGEMPRFVMLETVREYGLYYLQTHGELEESLEAHASYYLALVELARPHFNGAQQVQWLARLEQEKENLRAALTWLIQRKETERALRFCEAFGKFCGLRGYWGEEQYWLKTVLALPWSLEARAIRARVLRRAGHLAYRLRDLVLARCLLEESVALSRVQDDKQNLAGALVGLGWVLYRQNDITTASTLLLESVAAARVSGDRWALANALESLGRLAHFQGQTAEARQLLQESVKLSRELGDKESLARFLTTLVSIELAQNHTPQAAALAQESFALAQELGTKPLIALVLDSLGEVALASGEYERAAQCFEERIMLAHELGDRPTIAMKRLDLGEIALAKGDLTRAITYIEESLRFFREQDDITNIAAALQVLGDIKRMQGNLTEATALYNEASLLNSH